MATVRIQSKAVNAWRTQLTRAQLTIDALDHVLTRLFHEKKAVIEEEASRTLKTIAAREVTWGRIKINDDYTVELCDKAGNVVPRKGLSDGQKEILALSFIAGLKAATERTAPVVIDYLLGRLDEDYQDNVADELSGFGEQLLYFVLDSELTPGRRKVLEKQSNEWFTITKDPKTGISQIKGASV